MADDNFLESLGEYAEHPEIKGKVNDPQTLAKRFVDGLSEINRRVRVPGPDASKEDRGKFLDRLKDQVPSLVSMPADDDADAWSAFYQRLGAPESPDGYDVSNGAADLVEALAPTAHGLGLTKKQLAGLVDKMDALRSEATDAQASTAADTVSQLRKQWGDAYEEKMLQARLFAASRGLEDLMANNPLFGSNKQLLEVFAEFGKTLSENEQITTAMATSTGIMTRAEAEARRREVYSNPDHPYNKPFDSGHEEAVKEMVRLNSYIARLKEG